jgi:predicted dehydrogenase
MIEQVQPDAAYILMPPHHLYDLTIDCLEMGLNVFIEKPPGLTTHQVTWMAKYAEKNGVIGQTGWNRRFIPVMTYCRQKVLGYDDEVQQVVSAFYKHHAEDAGPYYRGAADILSCDAVHAVDTLRWLAGAEVASVTGSVRQVAHDFDDSFNALVEFDNGCVGILLANWASGARVHQFELHTKGAAAFINANYESVIHAQGEEFVERVDAREFAGSDELHLYYGYFQEDRHFIDCVKSGEQPSSSFADAIKTMELVGAIYHSAGSGRPWYC